MKDIGIDSLRLVTGVTSGNLENVREFWSSGVRMYHFAYGYAVSVTIFGDVVTVSKSLVTASKSPVIVPKCPVISRQYPGVLFQISPKVRNISKGYGGLKTVTNNLRHYDFSCLFGLNIGETRGDIAGVLVTRTLGGISHGCAVPFPFLLAGGALANLLKTKELRG